MFLTKLAKSIQLNQLFSPNERLLLGVSGGTDSMALLHGLRKLAPEFGWEIYVVHVNHQLRGNASEQDAQYVADYCKKYQIPYQMKRVDVQEKKANERGNKQAIARHLRYEAFREVATDWKIKKLVLAHHADDQVETILMRLLRGTGPSGLVGIRTYRQWSDLQIVRPLRNIFRSELEDYLHIENIIPREDESNQSLLYTRNRLRLELIPALEDYNPQVKQALLQLGNVIEQEEQVWEKWTKQSVATVSKQIGSDEYQIQIDKFLSLPVALQRRTVKLILSCLTDENLPYQSIEQVLELALHPSPSVWIFLPGGIKGVRTYDVLRLTKEYINQEEEVQWSLPLLIPGITYLPNGFMESLLTTTPPPKPLLGANQAVFDADALVFDHIMVRNRRDGDRIRPFGFKGHKQVKALLMEKKIPLAERRKLPFVLLKDEILWIPGVRRSAIAPITHETTRYLILRWSQTLQ